MTTIKKTLDALHLSTQDESRILNIRRAWDAYCGNFQNSLKIDRQSKADDNIKENRCRSIVDKGVSFLFGQDISFDVDMETSYGDRPQQYLDEFWK